MDSDVLAQLYDAHTWRQNVALYRRWEQRRDRSVNPDLRKKFGAELGRQYMTLSDAARHIVIELEKDKRNVTHDTMGFFDHTEITTRAPRFTFKLKWTEKEPLKLWFQRFEHEPWFELGYLDKVNLRWYNTEAELRKAVMSEVQSFGYKGHQLDMRQHKLDQARTLMDRMRDLRDAGRLPIEPHKDHVHVGHNYAVQATLAATPLNTEGIDSMYSENPEDLEAAAAHAMARAAELRAIDDKEPTGDEPVISWTWTPDYEGAKAYTYVAFKAPNGRWYVTGTGRDYAVDGVPWRVLYGHPKSEAIRNGDALIVTEWGALA